MRRTGFTMVELAIALLILALSVASLMEFARAEIEGVDLSLERFLAQQALGELEACWGGRYAQLFEREGFAGSPEEFGPLHASYLDDHPQTTSVGPGEASSAPVRQALAREWAALGLTRRVTFRKERGPDGAEVGVVTFAVSYRTDRGDLRTVERFEIVH